MRDPCEDFYRCQTSELQATYKASGWLVDARGELGSDGNVIGADVYVVGEVLSYTGVAIDMQCCTACRPSGCSTSATTPWNAT